MRLSAVLSVLLAAEATAAALNNQERAQTDDQVIRALLENPNYLGPSSTNYLRQILGQSADIKDIQLQLSRGNLATVLGTFGAVISPYMPWGLAAPISTVSDFQQGVPTEFTWPNVKKVKARYGPYRIPRLSERNMESVIMNVQGMAYALQTNAKKPCEGNCTMLSVQASLEFADGKPAENEKGAWFHHATLLATGPSVQLGSCQTFPMENLFMSGNERSRVYFGLPSSSLKSGYKLTARDQFVLHAKLMNLEDVEKWVWLTLDYDYIDTHDFEYKDGRMVYMSISPSTAGTCGTKDSPFGASNVTAGLQPKSLAFMEHSMPWAAERDGMILQTGGHGHDGIEVVETWFKDKLLCASVPTYTAGGTTGGHGHRKRQVRGPPKVAGRKEEHIAHQSRCNYPEGLPLKKGDRMFLNAVYDFNKHAGMVDKQGELQEIMGIVGSLIAYT